jgi:hypothetical protein
MGNSGSSNDSAMVTTAPESKRQAGWENIKKTRKFQRLRPKQKKMAKKLYITLISLGITVTLATVMVLIWAGYNWKPLLNENDHAALFNESSKTPSPDKRPTEYDGEGVLYKEVSGEDGEERKQVVTEKSGSTWLDTHKRMMSLTRLQRKVVKDYRAAAIARAQTATEEEGLPQS